MSSVDFKSEHAAANLRGSEGHYLQSLPAHIAIGLLNPTSFRARDSLAGIIEPASHLLTLNDAAFGTFFTTSWFTDIGGEFAWRGQPLDTFQISLNTAVALGGDPLRFACRLGAKGYPYVEGPSRAWLASIIDEGLSTGVFRSPGQGWEEVAGMLRERDDEPVVITFSGDGGGFPSPYLGGWFPAELGDDYSKLAEGQIPAWEARQDEWYESGDEPMKWRIAVQALRSSRDGLEMRPDTWTDLYFGRGITVFDLLAHDRAERLDRAFGIAGALATKEN